MGAGEGGVTGVSRITVDALLQRNLAGINLPHASQSEHFVPCFQQQMLLCQVNRFVIKDWGP